MRARLARRAELAVIVVIIAALVLFFVFLMQRAQAQSMWVSQDTTPDGKHMLPISWCDDGAGHRWGEQGHECHMNEIDRRPAQCIEVDDAGKYVQDQTFMCRIPEGWDDAALGPPWLPLASIGLKPPAHITCPPDYARVLVGETIAVEKCAPKAGMIDGKTE